jgi:hypothetical protein
VHVLQEDCIEAGLREGLGIADGVIDDAIKAVVVVGCAGKGVAVHHPDQGATGERE